MRTRNWIIVCSLGLMTLVSSLSYAQQGQAAAAPGAPASKQQTADAQIAMLRQDLQSQKKQIVAANMTLTDVEAEKFWPVYDKYNADFAKIYDGRVALIKEYAENYSSMTDAKATSLVTRFLESDKAINQLRLQYVPLFNNVISPKKTAAFFQIDRRVMMLAELQISTEIPLVKP